MFAVLYDTITNLPSYQVPFRCYLAQVVTSQLGVRVLCVCVLTPTSTSALFNVSV